MSTHISVIDAYHQSLIEEGAVVFHIGEPKAAEAEETPELEAETKVVRRGRPPKAKATEGAETK